MDRQKLSKIFNTFVGKPLKDVLLKIDTLAADNNLGVRTAHADGLSDNSIMLNRVTVVTDGGKNPVIKSIGFY